MQTFFVSCVALLKSPGWTAYMGNVPPEVKTERQSESMESGDCSNVQNSIIGNGNGPTIAASSEAQPIMPDNRAFVFPQPTSNPLSPSLLPTVGIFNQNNNVPLTPTFFAPVSGLDFKGGSIYSPLTIGPPASMAQGLPKTPTLPPPSPHATAFSMIGQNYFNLQPNTPNTCLLYTSPSPRDRQKSRMPSSA